MGAARSDDRSAVPRVSVVIPTYNRVDLTLEAVASVCNQTMGDLEIIVVDDGSADETRACMESRAAADPRIRYVPTDHSGFPGRVRNIGVDRGRAAFVAFLDSDDIWLPTKLERQLPHMVDGGYRICHTGERWLRNGREVSQAKRRHRRRGDLFADSLTKCILGPSTVLLDRSLFDEVGGFREDIEVAEDYELWLRITAYHEVCYLDETLTVKRAGHNDQLSEKYGEIEVFRITALRDLLERGFLMPDREQSPRPRRDTDASPPVHSAAGGQERGADLTRTAERRRMAEHELARKCRIYAAGARKRGRLGDARRFETLAERADSGMLGTWSASEPPETGP